jgi:hypothetical protein
MKKVALLAICACLFGGVFEQLSAMNVPHLPGPAAGLPNNLQPNVMNAALPALERQAYNDIIQLGLNPANFLIAARIIPSVQNIVRLIHFATNRVNNPLLPHQDLSDPRRTQLSIKKTSTTLRQAAKDVAGEKYVIKNEKLASVDTIIRSAALFLNAYTATMDAFRNPDIYTNGQHLLNFLNPNSALC